MLVPVDRLRSGDLVMMGDGRPVFVRTVNRDGDGLVSLRLSPSPDSGGWWTAPMSPDRHLAYPVRRPDRDRDPGSHGGESG